MKIMPLVNGRSDNTHTNFGTYHVLHFPAEYSNVSPLEIHSAIQNYNPEFKPLLNLMTKFISFVEKNFKGDFSDGDVITLNNGKTAYVRLTEKADALKSYTAFNLAPSTISKDAQDKGFNYIAKENGEFEQIKTN